MWKKIIKNFFILVTIFSFFYIARVTRNLELNWNIFLNIKVVFFSITSIILIISCLFISSYAYRLNMQLLSGMQFDNKMINSIFIKANIGKYIPGNFLHFAGRNILGQRNNLDQKVLLGSTVLLHVQTITIALLVPLIVNFHIYIDIFQLLKGILGKTYLFVMVGLIILVSALIFIFKETIFKQVKNLIENIRKMKAKKLVRNFAVMGAYLILYGISFLIIILSTTSLDWNFTNLAYIVLAFIIAWLCGLVVIGAPGGIGIREVVLLFLLKNIISEADLVLAVVLHRFCTIAADVISFLLVNIREKFKGLVYGQKKI